MAVECSSAGTRSPAGLRWMPLRCVKQEKGNKNETKRMRFELLKVTERCVDRVNRGFAVEFAVEIADHQLRKTIT